MTGLLASFGKPFKYQVAAFRLRLAQLQGTVKWDDVWQAQHDRAFMVAGAMKADLLADLAAAVDKAISQGTSLETFRKDFRALVEKNGWHGWTGEGTKGGEAWRTRVIYQTNLSTSYAAGRFAQLTEAGFPFWVYFHGNSMEPRHQHLAWDGLVLPPDHPFWATHYPPNGWGCSCYASGARTLAGAQRLGGNPDLKLPEGWQSLVPKTGAPVGIDKGWAYAPGASVEETVRSMAAKTVYWPYEIAKAYMADLPAEVRDDFAAAYRNLPSTEAAVQQFANRVIEQGPSLPAPDLPRVKEYQTLGLLTKADTADITTILGQDVAGYDFAVSRSSILHVFKKHGVEISERKRGQRAVVPADYGLLLQLLSAPDSRIEERGDIIMTKKIGNDLITAVFSRLPKRRMLSLVTMWVGV